MKLKPGLGAFNTICEGNGLGLFYSSRAPGAYMEQTHLNSQIIYCCWFLSMKWLKWSFVQSWIYLSL